MQTEAADQMGIKLGRLQRIEAGYVSINREVAEGFARVSGRSADVWLELQRAYNLWRLQTGSHRAQDKGRVARLIATGGERAW